MSWNRASDSGAVGEVPGDAEMRAWAAVHGSRRLQAAMLRGYASVRIYEEERAEHDFPGWSLLDEGSDLTLRPATDPTEAALDLEAQALSAAQALCMPPDSVRIVLVMQVHWSEDDGESVDYWEAVLVTGYLGDRQLIRAV